MTMRSGAVAFCTLSSILLWTGRAHAAGEPDLADLSIEQLAQIKVTSASKQLEPLSEAPAALFVITGQDIENSGVLSLPEALRLAPNLNVQQVDASQYAISARGFNGVQAGNKLLVLIDGRSIYTPLGDSVIWNLHQPLLEDVQQIEVISGPGGTLFGPNAVNGVVNVTLKTAQDTIGTLARATAGAGERSASLRHGFAIGSSGAMRVYADWHDREGLPAGYGGGIDDDFRSWQAGFRSDFGAGSDNITVEGDYFHADADTAPGDGARAYNLLARWSGVLGRSASFQLQSYVDWYKRQFTRVEDSLSTFDNQAQLNISAGPHEIVAGAGVRTTRDRFINNLNQFQLNPTSRRLWVYNIFAQDRFNLSPKLSLIGGVKVERSSFVGWQVLPNVRLAWQPSGRALLWAAVSRAVRTPSRIDRELEALPLLARSTDFTSEKLTAVEGGYRGQPASWLSFSVNLFYNLYSDIRTTELAPGGALPIQLLNGIKGHTYGIEAWGTAQLAPWWRLSLGGSALHKDLHVKAGRLDLQPRNSLGVDPDWQVTGSSQMDLTPKLKLTLDVRGVDELDLPPEVPGYVEAGGQLAYSWRSNVELFVAGRNLLHRSHRENGDPGASQLARRSIYLGTRLRF
jgi:iron complex outermembrane receptor protein